MPTGPWPSAVRSGVGRLLSRYASDQGVETAFVCHFQDGVVRRSIDTTGAEIELPEHYLPFVNWLLTRGPLLMIDDLSTDSLISSLPAIDLTGALVGVRAVDETGSILGVLIAHGLTPRSWVNQELERAGDVALAMSSMLTLDLARVYAERRLQAGELARSIRTQMHAISMRSAQAATLPEIARVLVRETPSLLDAAWCVVGIRRADRTWQLHSPPTRRPDFTAAFGGVGSPGDALLDYAAALDDVRTEITDRAVGEWATVRERLGEPDHARLIAARLSKRGDLSVVLLCNFVDVEFNVRRARVLDELLEDVRRVVERTAAAQRQIQTALELQRSLLPPRLPSVAGFEIGRLYNAAAHYSRVGGDWYDIVRIDATTTGFVVGDVAGHDIRSAAIMGQIRHVLASQLRDDGRPAGALASTDRYFADLAENVMATAVVIVVDRATHTAHIALAGHPPPVLLSGPSVTFLRPQPGPPIGLGYGGYADLTLSLQPDDVLIAYTDGVVETRDGNIADLLDGFISRLATADRSVRGLVRFLDQQSRIGELVDDVAALVLRIDPRAVPGGEWAGPSSIKEK